MSALMMIVSISVAQDIQQIEKTMSLGKQPAIYVEIEGADKDLAKDLWEDYVKDYGKTKRNKKAKEYYTKDARVPLISSSNAVTLYAKFEEGREQTTAYLWVDNAGVFEDDSDKLETFFADYYMLARKKVINNEIKEQEKVMKKLDKKMSKLIKKNEGYHKDIAKAEDKIRQAEENIEKNLGEQEEMTLEQKRQKEILEAIVEKLNSVGKI